MSLVARCRYTLYLAAVSSAAIGLLVALASADVMGLLPASAFHALFSPYSALAVYAASFLFTPCVAERIVIAGDLPSQEPSAKPPFGYAVRIIALAALGFALAMLAKLVVFLFERFA